MACVNRVCSVLAMALAYGAGQATGIEQNKTPCYVARASMTHFMPGQNGYKAMESSILRHAAASWSMQWLDMRLDKACIKNQTFAEVRALDYNHHNAMQYKYRLALPD